MSFNGRAGTNANHSQNIPNNDARQALLFFHFQGNHYRVGAEGLCRRLMSAWYQKFFYSSNRRWNRAILEVADHGPDGEQRCLCRMFRTWLTLALTIRAPQRGCDHFPSLFSKQFVTFLEMIQF